MRTFDRVWMMAVLICVAKDIFAQTNTYILNGTARQNTCNCYTLTTTTPTFQSGSVWNANKINLNTPFNFIFNVNLGCIDYGGADGIVFMLQPISTSVGTAGEGLGFEGVSPSIGISLDTWQNTNRNDPDFDHISIQKNGQVTHGNDLAGPVPISANSNNVEDCNWHTLRIIWQPSTKLMEVFFDGVKRLETTIDLISSVFNNDPLVYWGFSGATGGAVNVQQFCTALNPDFTSNLPQNGACPGESVQLTDASVSFAPIASYSWNFGDGTTSSLQQPPVHVYSEPGIYPVKLAITAFDGCRSDTTTHAITIGSVPDARFTIDDACEGHVPVIRQAASNTGSSYNWVLDGTTISTDANPVLLSLPYGSHRLQQTVTSLYNCGQPSTIQQNFTVFPKPVVSFAISDNCIQQPMSLQGEQNDQVTTISKWNWNFGDNQRSFIQNPVHQFYQPGNYQVSLFATEVNGCTSDTILRSVFINKPIADAGRDSLVLKNVTFYLNGKGNGSLEWTPAALLSDPFSGHPETSLNDDQAFVLKVTTAEGCTATDTVLVEVFKGSAVYVPTAFTPNHDGRNDILKPRYIGIAKVDYFVVYNRWGQQVFSTQNIGEGWNGDLQGLPAAQGAYVWILKAYDIEGKVYNMKGTVVVIR